MSEITVSRRCRDAGASSEGQGRDRQDLLARLRALRPGLEESLFTHVREAVPVQCGEEDVEYETGAYCALVDAVDYLLAGLEPGEREHRPLLGAVTAHARRAARAGVELEKVLRRYHAAEQRLAALVLEEITYDPSRPPLAAAQLIIEIHALLSELTAEVAATHQRELDHAASSPEERRSERVQALLAGSSFDTSGLGYELDCAWHVCVIALGSHARRALSQLASALGRQLLVMPRSEEVLYAWLGGERLVSVADIEAAPHGADALGVKLVIGEPASGMQGWRVSYRQAQAAFRVAMRRPRKITRYADVALLAHWAADETLARAFIRLHLSPLDEQRDKGVAARETLRAYFDTGHQIEATAYALGINRGTLRARLANIEAALGYPLHERKAELDVALRVEVLYGAEAGPERLRIAHRLAATAGPSLSLAASR
ncbi:MAG TPA: helix-turn-helix domain-containing protein [Solirubrobacteraceae bacterium]|nr:helix-turn-helix domain-containing protein [Solirubrobacteraceae bacterium]